MARLSLSIDYNVQINFPRVIASVSEIERTCADLLCKCANVLEICGRLGGRMQTEVNDTAQFSLNQATTDLDEISIHLKDLQDSAHELVEKLKRIERMARG